jgi:hypothetical protein
MARILPVILVASQATGHYSFVGSGALSSQLFVYKAIIISNHKFIQLMQQNCQLAFCQYSASPFHLIHCCQQEYMVFMLAGTKPTGLTRLTESRFSSCFPFLA